MMHRGVGSILVGLCYAGIGLVEAYGQLVLVEAGQALAPIVVYQDAPPMTRRAADELAEYIAKVARAQPEVVVGQPDPLPERAIWVGYQSALDDLFPDLDFDFQHPEEILIAANENHLVIAGRDRWDPDHLTVEVRNRTIEGVQQEYGTHNAVYTFLQDHLGVRWLWPGALGEDILERDTIELSPFEYRYHPQFRGRSQLFRFSSLESASAFSPEWARLQRLQLDSLEILGGHPFSGWWNRFHETNPEFFALQPDGTRGGGEQAFPNPRTVKLCISNPAVWAQWLEDAEKALERNPNLRMFGSAANDGAASGVCVCEFCRAWDNPDGELTQHRWQGIVQP